MEFEEGKEEKIEELTVLFIELEQKATIYVNDFESLHALKTVATMVRNIKGSNSAVMIGTYMFKAKRAYRAAMRKYLN